MTMAWPIPPSLAVYLKHPADFWALVELDSEDKKPKGASDDDWEKFREVAARAGDCVGKLVVKGRDLGVEALHATHERASGATLKFASKDWYAWADVKRKAKRGKGGYLNLGCALDHAPDGRVLLIPWVAPERSLSPDDLLGIVKVVAPESTEASWLSEAWAGNVALDCLPVTPASDLDVLLGQCGKLFTRLVEVADRLP
jgi:hypothetical protein